MPELSAFGQARSSYEFWLCHFLAYVTLGKWLNFSGPAFPHLENGARTKVQTVILQGCCGDWGLNIN